MSRLNLSGISKVYPSGETALYNVTFSAEKREFLVIFGGEKCGKTSLLKVIAGLEEHTSGVLEIDGKDMAEVLPKDRDVAMVFRNDTLYPSLNVFDNMAYGLRIRKASPAVIEQRVKSAAAILGLTDVLYRKPKTLTAAARQRVALGRAMAREPKLYLLDEPLAGIDSNLRKDMLNLIINVQARMEGAFVYATKNLSEALSIGTRLIILKKGFVQQIDSPANLYDYPANTYVAFLIGSPTINFVQHVKIVKEGEAYFAAFGGQKQELSQNTVKRFADIDRYVQEGRPVILGIRPEDASGADEGLSAEFVKDGEDGYAEFKLEGSPFTAKMRKAGDKAIKIDAERLYIFDAETRLTLLSRDGGYKQTGMPDSTFVPLSYTEEERIKENLKPKKETKKIKR